MKHYKLTVLAAAALALTASPAHATIDLLAIGSIAGTATDFSGQTGNLENGVAGNLLGGLGSGLAWAGGNTFLALPDRGPNATSWNVNLDDTASYIPRFQTMTLNLTSSGGGSLPFNLTPTLNSTTLLYSTSALNYAAPNAANNNIGGAPALNATSPGKYYFSGRSDNFVAGTSTNSANARLDTEGLRVSPDGKSVFISDEYGPYVYQFDRTTGERIKTFTLPANLAATTQSAQSALEISGNTVGRIANKGMEGLAITPDGSTLYGFMQSPLEQDSVGGAGKGQINRVVKINVATGAVQELAYNNKVGTKTFNSSEMLAVNDHQFIVLERDGSGLGNGDSTTFKQIRLVDFAGAGDVTNLSGEANLLASGLVKGNSAFMDLRAILNAHGIDDAHIPAKLEGMAFGEDVIVNGVLEHTLYVGNDNDFLSTAPGGLNNPNQWYVFGLSDADLAGLGITTFQNQAMAPIPEPSTYAALLGLAVLGFAFWRRRVTAAC